MPHVNVCATGLWELRKMNTKVLSHVFKMGIWTTERDTFYPVILVKVNFVLYDPAFDLKYDLVYEFRKSQSCKGMQEKSKFAAKRLLSNSDSSPKLTVAMNHTRKLTCRMKEKVLQKQADTVLK